MDLESYDMTMIAKLPKTKLASPILLVSGFTTL